MSEVPKGWASLSLAEAVAPDAPIIYGILQPGPDVEGGVPYVRPTEIGEDGIRLAELRRTSPKIAIKYTRSTLAAEDVILSIVGTIGKVAIVPNELGGANITQSSCRIRPDSNVTQSAFVSRFLRSPNARSQYDGKRLGTGVPRLNLQDVRQFSLPLPPPAEQRRIVAKIDRLSARSKRAREELERAQKLISRFRHTVLSSAFDGGFLINISQTRGRTSVQSYLAEKIRNGLSVAGSDLPPGVAALKLSALRTDTVDLSEIRYLPIQTEQAAKFSLVPGDLLVSRGNGALRLVGKAALVSEGCDNTIFPDTAFRLRPNPVSADPRWLLWMWNAPQMRAQIEAVARTTAGIWKISQADISSFELPDMTIGEQHEIVRRIEHAFAAIDRLAAEATSAQKLLDPLDQAVLAKAFRGELVPQDPNDEPASTLLERIRAERAAAPTPKRGRRPKAAP